MNCEKCGKPAMVHLTAIKDGKKTEQHLCLECAQDGDPALKNANINELLAKFVAKHLPDGPNKH
jgi:protein-arginine kinase activator protein McsA